MGWGTPACSQGAGRGPGLPGDRGGSRASQGESGPWPLTGCADDARPSCVPSFVRWTRRGTPSKPRAELALPVVTRALSPLCRAPEGRDPSTMQPQPASAPGPHRVCRDHPAFQRCHLSRGPWLGRDPGAPSAQCQVVAPECGWGAPVSQGASSRCLPAVASGFPHDEGDRTVPKGLPSRCGTFSFLFKQQVSAQHSLQMVCFRLVISKPTATM